MPKECVSVVMYVSRTGRVVRLLRASSAMSALLSEVNVRLNEVVCLVLRRCIRLYNVDVRLTVQGLIGKGFRRTQSSRNRRLCWNLSVGIAGNC